jgi:hypothetical protein
MKIKITKSETVEICDYPGVAGIYRKLIQEPLTSRDMTKKATKSPKSKSPKNKAPKKAKSVKLKVSFTDDLKQAAKASAARRLKK